MQHVPTFIGEIENRIESGEDAGEIIANLSDSQREEIRSTYFYDEHIEQGFEKLPEDCQPRLSILCSSDAQVALVEAVKPPGIKLTTENVIPRSATWRSSV